VDNPLRYQADSRLPAPGDGSRRCDLVTSVLTVTSGFMSCGTRVQRRNAWAGSAAADTVNAG
jgi:hypothetical protein